mmetsp:Transcript_25550/g.79471  ORF Transcript_25550/g.79471 Transcript_25550/m.79471 type:complete len:200 (-) Transcript_25550:1113-1712(-)
MSAGTVKLHYWTRFSVKWLALTERKLPPGLSSATTHPGPVPRACGSRGAAATRSAATWSCPRHPAGGCRAAAAPEAGPRALEPRQPLRPRWVAQGPQGRPRPPCPARGPAGLDPGSHPRVRQPLRRGRCRGLLVAAWQAHHRPRPAQPRQWPQAHWDWVTVQRQQWLVLQPLWSMGLGPRCLAPRWPWILQVDPPAPQD